jgi:hypothetical protein
MLIVLEILLSESFLTFLRFISFLETIAINIPITIPTTTPTTPTPTMGDPEDVDSLKVDVVSY